MFAQMDTSKSWLASYRFTQRPIEARAQDRFTFDMKPVNPDRLLFKVRGGEFSEATKALEGANVDYPALRPRAAAASALLSKWEWGQDEEEEL